MEEAPILRLEIFQGPRQGETLDFKPGTAVRIGRVVKGNNLPIKDSGISSKHLTIVARSSEWLLRDLDSSNGTVFDDSPIPPQTDFTLNHHSTIKIGEFTSIRVIFLPRSEPPNGRNPTRRGKARATARDLNVEQYDASVVPPAPVTRKSTRQRSVAKDLNLKGRVQVQVQSIVQSSASVVHDVSELLDPPKRATRRSKRERNVVKDLKAEALAEEGNGWKDRGWVQSVKVNGASVAQADSERVVVGKVEEAKCTQNPSLIDISDCSFENPLVPVVEKPKNARGVSTANVEKKTKKGVGGKRRVLEKESEDGNSVKEVCDGNWPDLNKMSLAEWFDFLEVHLPRQIIDETEEMIDSMTQKAERLRKYILEMQQQNDKAKIPL